MDANRLRAAQRVAEVPSTADSCPHLADGMAAAHRTADPAKRRPERSRT
jgi:hypothetical protein